MSTRPGQLHLDRRASAIATLGATMGEPDDLLTTNEVARWFAVTHQWLEIGRHRGYGPPYIRLAPSRVRYRRSDLIKWLDERRHRWTREYR
jgi:hypothetical protein